MICINIYCRYVIYSILYIVLLIFVCIWGKWNIAYFFQSVDLLSLSCELGDGLSLSLQFTLQGLSPFPLDFQIGFQLHPDKNSQQKDPLNS